MNNYIGPKSLNRKKIVDKALKKEKSVAVLKGELQEIFNTYIRYRDTKYDKGQPYFICISCNNPKPLDQMNAGHFWPVGGHEAVRYDEDNVHGQCIHCNNFASNGVVMQKYQINLVKRIGHEKFTTLSLRRFNKSKMMRFELQLLIDEYKTKCQQLKK